MSPTEGTTVHDVELAGLTGLRCPGTHRLWLAGDDHLFAVGVLCLQGCSPPRLSLPRVGHLGERSGGEIQTVEARVYVRSRGIEDHARSHCGAGGLVTQVDESEPGKFTHPVPYVLLGEIRVLGANVVDRMQLRL